MRRFKKIVIMSTTVLWVGLFVGMSVGAQSWPDGWHDAQGNVYDYRTPVDITSQTDVIDYQLGIRIKPDSPVYNHAQADGKDVRIVMESQERFFELPYWVEEWNSGGESKIWAKVPSIRDTVRIYLYYGSPEVETQSNGKGVFEFFEDFSEFAGWEVYDQNKPTITTMKERSVIEMRGWAEIVHPISLRESNYAFESLSTLTFGKNAYMPFFGFGSSDRRGDEDNAYQFGYNVWSGRWIDNIRVYQDRRGSVNVSGKPAYAYRTGWARTSFRVFQETLTQVVDDESQGKQIITAQDTLWKNQIPREVGVIVWSGSKYAIDWLLVRKYVEPEPTYVMGKEKERPLVKQESKELMRIPEEKRKESEIIELIKEEIIRLNRRIVELERRVEELESRVP